MWAFIAMAVLGLILKVVGPKDAEQDLAAAGLSISQIFNLDSKPAETDQANGPAETLAPDAGTITTLDGRVLIPAEGKAPAAREPATPPAKPEPAAAPH